MIILVLFITIHKGCAFLDQSKFRLIARTEQIFWYDVNMIWFLVKMNVYV